MATINRIGFGQVEPNHLSAQRTAQIYAQLPADAAIEVLENGQFVKYDYANGVVHASGEGEWMMVYNEVKLYDGWRETYKDFAMRKVNYTEGVMTPRVFKTNVGDIYTTNTLEKGNTAGTVKVEGTEELSVGDTLGINEAGFLAKAAADASDMKFQVVKIYTLADGQDAVKVMRIA